MALTKPALAAALGIDGGAIFQILAVEDLGLSPFELGNVLVACQRDTEPGQDQH